MKSLDTGYGIDVEQAVNYSTLFGIARMRGGSPRLVVGRWLGTLPVAGMV